MKKTYVIYHSADHDGIFCREIARKFLPDAQLVGWDYGQPTPLKGELDGTETLYMLDISVPDLMDHPNLIWIDHHKSAMEKYGAKPGYQIDGVAACRLAWQWFDDKMCCQDVAMLPNKQEFIDLKVMEPLAVRLAGQYDIWDKSDPRAELFQHGLRSRKLTPEWWNDLLGDYSDVYVDTLLEAGKGIQYAQTRSNESIIKEIGFTLEWEGLKFLACNHARYNSHLFTAGLTPEHDACFGFKWTGKDWSVSLYHAPGKEHHDLSLIAVKYGGGGHRGACGFRTNKLPFLQ
jgi:uncharacterized protein